MEKIYYLDNAATTKTFDEVFDLMKQNNEMFYNPSASYMKAIYSRKEYDKAREMILKHLHGSSGKLIFTGSATESNNMVFEGLHLRAGQTVLISKGEHPAVYQAAHRLEKKGIVVQDVNLDKTGKVDFEHFKKLMNENVALVSVMHVSNETGAVNEIKKLCEFAKQVNRKVLFHSDGVQAFGKVDVNLNDLGVDLYSISAHKIYAPRGIAGLWIKNSVLIDPLLVGGGQENGYRSSTENVAGAVAFAFAVNKVCNERVLNFEKILNLKNEFLRKLTSSSIGRFVKVNSTEDASPYIISISFEGIKGEVLMHSLENSGILISTGSACSSKKAGNRTLEAMGVSKNDVVGSVRISFSPYFEYDVNYIVNEFISHVERFEKNNIKK